MEVEEEGKQLKSTRVVMLPCPFCGSSNIRESEGMFSDDDGEHPGVECINCDASNRREFWNTRNDSCS